MVVPHVHCLPCAPKAWALVLAASAASRPLDGLRPQGLSACAGGFCCKPSVGRFAPPRLGRVCWRLLLQAVRWAACAPKAWALVLAASSVASRPSAAAAPNYHQTRVVFYFRASALAAAAAAVQSKSKINETLCHHHAAFLRCCQGALGCRTDLGKAACRESCL